jgi:hypothetical protein
MRRSQWRNGLDFGYGSHDPLAVAEILGGYRDWRSRIG